MTSVFNEGEVAQPSVNDLVGDGKKFKTVDDLARGKVEADAHIDQLQNELSGLRAELDKRLKAAEQLEQLKNELKQRQDAPTQPRATTTPELSASDIEALVERTITARERNRSASQNIEESNDRAIKHYGSAEAANKAVKAIAAEQKISIEKLKEIAAESPTAFTRMLGIEGAPQVQAVGSFVQPSAGVPDKEHGSAQQKPGTYEFAENVRRTDPRKYWDPKFQNEYVVKPRLAGTYKIPNN